VKTKIIKIGGSVVLVFLLIIAGFSIYGYTMLKRSLPPLKGEIGLKGLKQKVTVYRDSMGVPQIMANNEHDAYFALGYLHAADRLFQIDLTRRLAQGKLSELFGSLTLNWDRHQRLVGHKRLAQKFLNRLTEEDRNRLQAYADGINRYVSDCKTLPFEYLMLGKDFEPYSLSDILSVLSFQTWFSNFLMSSDDWVLKIFDKLGEEKAKSLAPPYPVWAPFTIPQETERQPPLTKWLYDEYFGDSFIPFRMANSSNAWAVDPKHSLSGHAMLASDPHLEIRRLPQFWYLVGIHIKNPQLRILGITSPGLPFVAMGHNSKAAWAFTVGGIDVNEIFIEKTNPRDSSMYLSAEGWRKFEIIEEPIFIKGQKEPLLFKIKQTTNGPVFWSSDSMKSNYSLHWAGYDVDLAKAIHANFTAQRADNFNDFRRAVTQFGALDANWIYADARGNIGYQLGTPIPVRPLSVNKLPVPGWIDSLKWKGFRRLDETPYSFNPSRGWLATCNNKQDEAHLNYPLIGKFFADRIIRISELLAGKPKFSVNDMQNFQTDRVDRYLQRWQPVLIDLLEKNNYPKAAELLREWDGSTDAASKQTALIVLFLTRLRHLTFDDELGKLSDRIDYVKIERIFKSGPDFWFDDINTENRRETREEIADKALRQAVAFWKNRPWGDFQTLTIAHPFSKVPILSSLLGLKKGPFPWGGTPGSLNSSFFWENKKRPGYFRSIVGPSWRFVIDFADPDGATFVLPSGISGNPASPFFFNFFDWWKEGKRWNVPLSPEKVKKRARYVLQLIPDGGDHE